MQFSLTPGILSAIKLSVSPLIWEKFISVDVLNLVTLPMPENFYGFEDKCQSLETGKLPAGIGKQECFTPV